MVFNINKVLHVQVVAIDDIAGFDKTAGSQMTMT